MIDCFKMLSELAAAGVSNAETARRIDVHPHSVAYWKKRPYGKGLPRVDHYLNLVALYCEVVQPQNGQNLVSMQVSTSIYNVVVTRTA